VTDVEISADGTVYAKYENGDLKPLYQIALANVASPDNLIRCRAMSIPRVSIPASSRRVSAAPAASET
jgi:hypothetical protein